MFGKKRREEEMVEKQSVVSWTSKCEYGCTRKLDVLTSEYQLLQTGGLAPAG